MGVGLTVGAYAGVCIILLLDVYIRIKRVEPAE